MSFVALLLMLGGQVTPAEAPPVMHEQLLDEVGRADLAAGRGAAMTVRHRTLPTGSFAEVTALDSGRTIVVRVDRDPALAPDVTASLDEAAASALGLVGGTDAKVRIRPAVPSPAEQALIRAGKEVSRLPAPAPLLAALRRRLPTAPAPTGVPVAATPSPAPTPAPKPRPQVVAPVPKPVAPVAKPAPTGRWFVQVATLSDAGRAGALAKSVGGVVRSAGRLYRVQAGPFTTRAAAETARASIARRGFGDARIIAQD